MDELKNEPYQMKAKNENRKAVLQSVWKFSPISRSDIAKLENMNKSTVTNIINELIDERIIVSVGNRQDGKGRSSNLLMLNEKFGYIIGVMISTIIIKVAISDIYAKILWKGEFCANGDYSSLLFLDQITELIKNGLEVSGIPREKIIGIGISAPSIVERSTGLVYATPSVNLYNAPIGEYFRSVFNVPVFVQSLATNAARAEKWFGESLDCTNVACLEIGKGVGLGLILNGQIFTGSHGFAGSDVSHMTLVPNGPLCVCGRRGCWETVGSIRALGEKTIEETTKLADQGDQEAIQQLSSIGKQIGNGIAIIVKILNPEKVVISGPIKTAKNWIYNPMITSLKTLLWPHVFNNTTITYSSLVESPPVIGALMSVIETIID